VIDTSTVPTVAPDVSITVTWSVVVPRPAKRRPTLALIEDGEPALAGVEALSSGVAVEPSGSVSIAWSIEPLETTTATAGSSTARCRLPDHPRVRP
jgi:hypothetical protein